jgi:hypothetical protein
MPKPKDTGLVAIAQSMRKMPGTKQAGPKPARTLGKEKPPLELEGRRKSNGVSLDAGLWTCLHKTADILTIRMGVTGHERVTLVKVLKTACIAFHELPLEQQIELVRKHD